ncbi:MAG: antitoxin, RHH family protein [Proteobacteria bacterium]|jgi:metal-responsive CopG/Arc/MetJ family transcriptional regulator|nr:antitoxin, RHH family protein [Pseudomonadota bacterium]
MPAKNPRVNVVMEKSLFSYIHDISQKEGLSMSMVVRDLIKEALEAKEDDALSRFAEERDTTFDPSKALTHEQVWT